jgi:hypothetical protein
MSEVFVITPNSTISQSQGQVSTEIDGEVVLMDIEKGSYFGMNHTLSRIWKLIETPVSVSTLCAQLTEEYDVTPDECMNDLLESLEGLKKENLVEVS